MPADTELSERLVLPARDPDLGSLYPWFEAIAKRLALPSKLAYRIHVVLEEAVANAVLHATGANEVTLDVTATRARVVAVLRDRGQAFDPLSVSVRSAPLTITEAEIGGLGLTLMHANCSDLRYRRLDGYNELTMGFDVTPPAAAHT